MIVTLLKVKAEIRFVRFLLNYGKRTTEEAIKKG